MLNSEIEQEKREENSEKNAKKGKKNSPLADLYAGQLIEKFIIQHNDDNQYCVDPIYTLMAKKQYSDINLYKMWNNWHARNPYISQIFQSPAVSKPLVLSEGVTIQNIDEFENELRALLKVLKNKNEVNEKFSEFKTKYWLLNNPIEIPINKRTFNVNTLLMLKKPNILLNRNLPKHDIQNVYKPLTDLHEKTLLEKFVIEQENDRYIVNPIYTSIANEKYKGEHKPKLQNMWYNWFNRAETIQKIFTSPARDKASLVLAKGWVINNLEEFARELKELLINLAVKKSNKTKKENNKIFNEFNDKYYLKETNKVCIDRSTVNVAQQNNYLNCTINVAVQSDNELPNTNDQINMPLIFSTNHSRDILFKKRKPLFEKFSNLVNISDHALQDALESGNEENIDKIINLLKEKDNKQACLSNIHHINNLGHNTLHSAANTGNTVIFKKFIDFVQEIQHAKSLQTEMELAENTGHFKDSSGKNDYIRRYLDKLQEIKFHTNRHPVINRDMKVKKFIKKAI